jgi:hypothetical protein
MKQFTLLLFCICGVFSALFSQSFQVQGIVTNEKDETPLAGASVFINNGSKGTTTDQEGRFTLTGISYNSFELVISFVSYETIVINISPENINKRFRVKMSPKQNELEEVVVGQVEKDGWKKWGKTFMDNFLGTSANAQKCILLNPETLIFRHNKKSGVLKVVARDQLKIRNNGLGYNISYQLEQFEFDPFKGMVVYLGYVNFDDMATDKRRKSENWSKQRKIAYQGSLTHFMRSFYENNLVKEGFNMRRLIRLNKRDSATRPYYDRIIKKNYVDIDTSKFYIQFVKHGQIGDPVIHLLAKKSLEADSIRYTDSANNQMLMHFVNDVQVVFLNESESREYLINQRRKDTGGPQVSTFYFTGMRPIVVLQNGLYFEPLTIFSEGYWAFEKLAELLPADYEKE